MRKKLATFFPEIFQHSLERLTAIVLAVLFSGCGKSGVEPDPPPDIPASFNFTSLRVNGIFNGFEYKGVNKKPVILLSFDSPLQKADAASSITIKSASGPVISYSLQFLNSDSTVLITPASELSPLTTYTVTAATTLKSAAGWSLRTAVSVILRTSIDSSDKFPRISDEALLDLVQKNNFKYFYDFGHPVSGLARERNSSGDLVTSGGSGMGIMAIIAGIHRNFISREEGLARIQKITDFLSTKAERFHGAFPHWLNGNTGKTIPFSTDDNGADLVETSYLIAGLLTARQYFNLNNTAENTLRNDINAIWNAVDWEWFRRDGQQVLYWHWSPDKGWAMNMKIQGWNECLITYVLAAASNAHGIPATVYTEGWARNGAMKNGNTYYGKTLPLGPAYGGPLFLAHYSFLGINPDQLKDAYADYELQVKAHTLINYDYCTENPKQFYGYSDSCWGLTASDNFNGYSAHSPTNDIGVITPTAALSSFPYSPQQSMAALQFFYYKLGDKIWKDYGFVDAFSLDKPWFAESHLAIDQGPIVIMIENYRSGLIWNLLMSAPEIKSGLGKLGFTSPNL